MDERAPAAGKSDEGDADWIGVDMTQGTERKTPPTRDGVSRSEDYYSRRDYVVRSAILGGLTYPQAQMQAEQLAAAHPDWNMDEVRPWSAW